MRLESIDVAVRHPARERWWNRLALLGAWLALPITYAIVPASRLGAGGFCLGPLGVLFFTSLLLGRSHGAPIAGVRTPGKPGTLEIDDEGVTLTIAGRCRRFARGDIASGWTERSLADDVVLQMRSGEIVRMLVADREQARTVLHAAGVAPEQRAVTLRLGVAEPSGSRVVMVFLALVVGGLAVLTPIGFIALAVAGPFSGAPVLLAWVLGIPLVLSLVAFNILLRPLITATLRIGTDGVVVERLLRRRRIPRRSFRSASASGNDLVISARDTSARLVVSSPAEAETVAQRINEAMAEQRAVAAAVEARLDRRGREVGPWLREVRAHWRATTGYREATLDPEDLALVVADGAAPASLRIAAAAALARDNAGKKRVRIAAEACADERLRAALVEAAEEEIDEARIRKALDVELR
jgi:hypothetical protein